MTHERGIEPAADGPDPRRGASPVFTRRRALGLGVAGLGAVTLASCGSGPTVTSNKPSSGGTAGPGGGSGGGPVSSSDLDYSGVKPAANIEFWSTHPGSSAPLEKKLIEAYNSSQSETTVKLVTAGANYADVAQKFQTALASNNVPALVTLSDVWWFTYVLNGDTIPIEPAAKAAGLDTSDYVETFFDDYKYNDNHWAVPYARSTPLFYYNKGHFHKAGLPDRAPKTWDEMDDFAKKLQGADLGTRAVYHWAKPDNYLAWYYQNKAWGWGGAFSDKWDLSPMVGSGTIESLQWAAKTMTSNGGWAGVTSNSQSNDLAAGSISTCCESTGAMQGLLKDAKFDVGAGFLPGGPKSTDHVCPTGGTGISISMKSGPEQQLAAIKFLKWLTSPENAVKFSAYTGYLPVRKSADTSELTQKTPLIKVSLSQLDHLRSQDWARVFITGGDLKIGTGIGKVLLNKADPKSTMEGVQKELQSVYEKDIKPHLNS